LCEGSVFLVRGVGILARFCARGRYSLAPRVGIPLRHGSVFFARAVGIRCARGRYYGRLPNKKCATSRLLATKPCVRGRYRGAWWVRAGRGHLCHRSVRQRRHLARYPTAETVRSLCRGSVSTTSFCAGGRYSVREESVFSPVFAREVGNHFSGSSASWSTLGCVVGGATARSVRAEGP
jgi:hypothetical protein